MEDLFIFAPKVKSYRRSNIKMWFISAFTILSIIAFAGMFFQTVNSLNKSRDEVHRLKSEISQLKSEKDGSRFYSNTKRAIKILPLKKMTDEKASFLSKIISDSSAKYNLDPLLVVSVVFKESRFSYTSVSSKHDHGLMQVRSTVWRKVVGFSTPEDLLNPETNINVGSFIISYYLDSCNGNLPCALGKYNGAYPDLAYANSVISVYKELKSKTKGEERCQKR